MRRLSHGHMRRRAPVRNSRRLAECPVTPSSSSSPHHATPSPSTRVVPGAGGRAWLGVAPICRC